MGQACRIVVRRKFDVGRYASTTHLYEYRTNHRECTRSRWPHPLSSRQHRDVLAFPSCSTDGLLPMSRHDRSPRSHRGPGHRPCFFFQAEDGIRDYKVTGVQTCALPICPFGQPAAGAGLILIAIHLALFCLVATAGWLALRRLLWTGDLVAVLLAAGIVANPDRESVGEGKRGELGGGRIIKKKKRVSSRHVIKTAISTKVLNTTNGSYNRITEISCAS